MPSPWSAPWRSCASQQKYLIVLMSVGVFASLMAFNLFFLGLIPSGVSVNPRYETSLLLNTHFSRLIFRWFLCRHAKTLSRTNRCLLCRVYQKIVYVDQHIWNVPEYSLHEPLKTCWAAKQAHRRRDSMELTLPRDKWKQLDPVIFCPTSSGRIQISCPRLWKC